MKMSIVDEGGKKDRERKKEQKEKGSPLVISLDKIACRVFWVGKLLKTNLQNREGSESCCQDRTFKFIQSWGKSLRCVLYIFHSRVSQSHPGQEIKQTTLSRQQHPSLTKQEENLNPNSKNYQLNNKGCCIERREGFSSNLVITQ